MPTLCAFFQVARQASTLHVVPLVSVHASSKRNDVIDSSIQRVRLSVTLAYKPLTVALPFAYLALKRITLGNSCHRDRRIVCNARFSTSFASVAKPVTF